MHRHAHQCFHRCRGLSTGQASDRTHKTSPKDIRYWRDSGASSELGVHRIQEVTEKFMRILLAAYSHVIGSEAQVGDKGKGSDHGCPSWEAFLDKSCHGTHC